ncbi:hypothetical protein [Actinokineospora pegani]|uniref:hypothetical protein n=1 Tax=Actinokineospora pegani TaxID=2654637 RepID=UPI0018D476C2|nr:hypothetical protein [Actinokineospora pegani]
MGILGILEDTDYLPDFGTLVVRDRFDPEGLPAARADVLHELATRALPGALATAGDGWLHGSAGDPPQQVRLEAHDTEPPSDLDAWADVVRTPFRSRSGRVALGLVSGGEEDDTLDLGRSGLFDVRVSRRPIGDDDGEDEWLAQFWPATAKSLPRWVKRTHPAVRSADPGWRMVLGYHCMEVAWFASGHGPHRTASWYDEPFVGHRPDPDVRAQLGAPTLTTNRDAVTLLLSAGVLAPEDDGCRLVEHPPPATDRLALPADLATRLTEDAVRTRYTRLAADLVSIAAWGNPCPVDDLADRLLAAPDDIPPLLAYAESDKLIHRDEDGVRALLR